MTDAAPLPEGTLVAGKLRVVRLLGKGGMGAVYEVEHEFTKHRRALKLLHADMAKHQHIVARFLREASAAGRIGNQHIVETFDAGKLDSGEPYLVMELLDGETLDARLRRKGTLAVDEIADLVGQACDGVQAAHEAGIIHRDLKPENIVIIERREGPLVKLLDFGISRFDPAITGTNAVTREGSALGTPYYMSPEQIEGESDVDARTDVYALGIVLYECATGRRPFEASALPLLSVLIHKGEPTPLATLRPELPSAFVELIARAMARGREARFQTARELGDALLHFGSSALGATLAGSDGGVSSRRSVPVRVSEPSPSSTPVADFHSSPKALAPSMAGSAVSVAQEKRSSPRLRLIAGGVGSLGVVTWLVVSNPFAATSQGPATLASAVPPPASVSAASRPTAAPTPVPSAVPSASAAASVTAPPASASAAPARPTAPTPSAAPGVQPKPAASTRAVVKDMAPNPFADP